ncbi:aquaporin [Streptomyces sp. NPDC057616]|uniref:aquaporin n=1 Tax=Streptomyces sp. NPDC057616 TaxID=3346183 RepID=UPI0036D16022
MNPNGGRRGCPWTEWLSEFAATAILLFVTVSLFRLLFGPDSAVAQAIPSAEPRLVIDALVSGATVGLLIASPLGRRSGGHLNPAVSLAFWLLRALPGRDAVAYGVAQLAGSVAGVAAGRALWGGQVAAPEVGYATVRAAHGVPWTVVFAAEAAAAAVMLAVAVLVAARPRSLLPVPVVAGTAVAVLILVVGQGAGGSFNPARQFGPELFSGDLGWLWVYLTAPPAGAAAFALVRRRLRNAPRLPCPLCERHFCHPPDPRPGTGTPTPPAVVRP